MQSSMLTSEQYTNSNMKATSRYTHKAVQYPGMKEQPLQTQENNLAPTRSEEKKKNPNKKPQPSTVAIKWDILRMYV